MFGLNEKEMQEAEKLCDLFDRMRKYARDKKIAVVCATAHHQPAPDVTDFTFTFTDCPLPRAMDYIGIIRNKESPLSGTLVVQTAQLIKYDMTLPIGYSAMRDGVTQTFDHLKEDCGIEFDRDFEPVKNGDVIILGAGYYEVTRPIEYRLQTDPHLGHSMHDSMTSRCMGKGLPLMADEGASTPKQAAEKRQRAPVHVNGRPKKGWQK